MIGKRKDGLTSQHCSTCIGHTSLTFFEKAQKQKAIEAPLRAYRDIAMASPSKKVSPPRLRESNRGKEKIDDRRMQGERPLWYPRGKNARIDEAAPKEKITTAYFPIVQP
jgi:hypothetical protein